MRIIGFILVVFGALALGYEGFVHAAREKHQTVWVPPVVGGIALVSGLLLQAVSGRRGET
jgi:hypothetical protein